MRFLCVGTTPWRGGTEAHFAALATGLVAARHSVAALVRPGGFIARDLAGSGVALHGGRFRNALDPKGIAGLLRLGARVQPDWLVGDFGKEYWPLLLAGRRLGVPVALFHHRAAPLSRHSAYLVPRLAQRFFAASEYVRSVCIAGGAPAARVQVSYNPVDVRAYRPDPVDGLALRRSALGLDADAIVLGYAGRILCSKGVFPLLDAVEAAMARVPPLHCAWIGEGADLGPLQARIAAGSFRHRHHVLGWVERMVPYYRALSIVAMPSLAPEAFGRVLIEAQACGVPVLASGHSGICEAVAPGGGELLPAGAVDAWRDAIVRLCDAHVRARLAASTRPFVCRRFSSGVVVRRFLAALQGTETLPPPAATLRVATGLPAGGLSGRWSAYAGCAVRRP